MTNKKAVGVLIVLSAIYLPLSLAFVGSKNPRSSHFQVQTLTPAPSETIETINDLIVDENCQLPCWWGLILGESSIAQIKEQFIEIFGRDNIRVFKGNTYIRIGSSLTVISQNYPDPDLLEEEAYNFSIDAWTAVDMNQLVGIALRIPIPQYHRVDWTPYAPKSILSRYGEPDDIAYLGPIMNSDCCIDLVFRYYNLGLYVKYSIEATYTQNQYAFCNELSNIAYDGIILFLEAEELRLDNFGLLETARHKDPYELEIDQATNLTKAEFTELFSQENACVTVTY